MPQRSLNRGHHFFGLNPKGILKPLCPWWATNIALFEANRGSGVTVLGFTLFHFWQLKTLFRFDLVPDHPLTQIKSQHITSFSTFHFHFDLSIQPYGNKQIIEDAPSTTPHLPLKCCGRANCWVKPRLSKGAASGKMIR